MLTATDVTLSYGRDVALSGVSLAVALGETVALVGPSGSGKTSLLYCLSGLIPAQSGSVRLDDVDLGRASPDERCRVRREHFGFVFQFAELVPELTLLENVELPLRLLGVRRREARHAAAELLDRLGVSSVSQRRPAEVSGGQCQRAAVARAVIHRPDYVFADEPTGSLDSESGRRVLELLLELSAECSSALVLVTHDLAVAGALDRRITIRDGCVA